MNAPSSELVLPPLSPVLVGRPYASVPLLAAYAEQRGVRPIRQVNLNQAYVRETMLQAAADRPERSDAPGGIPVSELDAAEQALVEAVPRAVADAPDDAVLLAAVARDPAVRSWLFDRAGLGAQTDEASAVDVGACVERLDRLTGMRAFFGRHYHAHGVPRLVGVSVPFATQLAPALLLARVLHEMADSPLFVVLGGPLPSLLDDGQIGLLLRGSAVDGVVRREGEESFRQLLELPSFDTASLATVPALCFHTEGGVRITSPAGSPQKLTDTKPQPFDSEYLNGAVELPVMVGRGCYYTCAFCDYIELYERINFRRAEEVTESVRLATEQSTTGSLHFVYEVMPLRYERRLARILAAAGLGIRWRGFQRVFGEMTRQDVRMLEASGCVRLDIGLESADEGTLRLMNKGYTREEIGSFLTSFADSSIQLLINIIVDYPGLSYDRAMAAARFLAEVTRDIDYVHFEVLRFALGRNSQMYRTPEKFGLEVLTPGPDAARVSSPTQVPFRSRWAMSESERDRVEAYYRTLNASFRQRRVRAVAESSLLSGAAPSGTALGEWSLRVEPIVVARASAVGADSLVVRRMLGGETFVLPSAYDSLLASYRQFEGGLVALPVFLDTAGAALRRAGLTVRDGVELLAELDLLQPGAWTAREPVRVGISSDCNFYRGGVRSSSPGVAR
ncbi:MAG: B12-binding domain-containing radical SAM protein [Pseudonocardiaceae bacterium]